MFLQTILFILILGSSILSPARLKLPQNGMALGVAVNAGPMNDELTASLITDYMDLIGQPVQWAYLSNNWIDAEVHFPWLNVVACETAGVVPYIRMMPWSDGGFTNNEPIFSMQVLLNGDYDYELYRWAEDAKSFGKPLIVEFGPEVNGDWFPWNGQWNGAGEKALYGDPNLADGPERFKDTFKHIIEIFREVGANNVTWVFHVDTSFSPWKSWNRAKYYYPGDDYIDWIGLSVFGRQHPNNKWTDFEKKQDFFWPQVLELKTQNPVIIAEVGVIEDPKRPNRKARWIESVFRSLKKEKYKKIKGLSWWSPTAMYGKLTVEFAITSSPQATKSFVNSISDPFWLKGLEWIDEG